MPRDPLTRSNEMDVRDPTEAELAALAGVDIPPITAAYDASRDEDEDGEGYVEPTVATPTLADMNARFVSVLEAMEQRQASGDVSSNNQLAASMQLIAEAMNGFRQAQLQGAQTVADMQRRTVMPENKFPPLVSAFNGRGDKDFPRPALKCPMLLPWPAEAESLTREEIDLLNLLVPGEYTIRRADRTPIKLTVTVHLKLDSDQPSQLLIHHDTAFNNDNHRLMPYDWIRQMVVSHPHLKAKAIAVVTMDEEEALILGRQFNTGQHAIDGQSVVSVGA